MRRALALLAITLAAATPTAAAGTARSRCDVRTPVGDIVDCFSGAYHGTGFLPMEETISFVPVSLTRLHADPLWRQWVTDAARSHDPKPCGNANAVAYRGTFSFYNGGTFIACSRRTPNILSGFFRNRGAYHISNEETTVTLTHGVFSASADSDNVLELVFSDAGHQHFDQPEVVLGTFKG
jgi:hypothetical protein